jgi:CRISPR-associated protein Csx17
MTDSIDASPRGGATPARHEFALAGCTPTPLAHYLKALGILRLLSTRDPQARAAWRNDRLVVQSCLDTDALLDFFLRDYRPTPGMAPWNGGSGFYEKDNKAALEAIQASPSERFALYRHCLALADTALAGMKRDASPKGEDKATLLTRLRAQLPDEALDWLDAAVVLAGDSPQYPPLLGTGGNDGRLDFTNNFMQRLGEVLDLRDEAVPKESPDWLRMALFGATAPGLVKKAIGQFSPGQAGGPNASTGFEADSAMNPWDFVLMIEGALPFAAAAVRRNADDGAGVLSYPFTVKAVGAGAGNLGEGDTGNARGELWMPLWNQPATYAEVHALLAEGRVALGRKPARDALDFVRAVHRLGGYRGVRSFQRFGLLMRSGKAYLATPLDRVQVEDAPPASLLDDLDHHGWLGQFRRFAQGDAANRFLVLRHRLDNAFFEMAGHAPRPAEVQSLLVLLGDIQEALTASPRARDAVPPLPRLPAHWASAADDHSAAFRIARALAGLGQADGSASSGGHAAKAAGPRQGCLPLPLYAQWFPIHPGRNVWMEQARKAKGASNDPLLTVRLHRATAGRLPKVLLGLLERRLWLAERLGLDEKRPLLGPAGATLEDVAAFLHDEGMDARIASLLPGLCLVDMAKGDERATDHGIVPPAFALLKLCMTPNAVLRKARLLDEQGHLPTATGLLAELGGNLRERAVRTAWRRLHASGLNLCCDAHTLPSMDGIAASRAAAALLIPLDPGAYRSLFRAVLKSEPSSAAIPAA